MPKAAVKDIGHFCVVFRFKAVYCTAVYENAVPLFKTYLCGIYGAQHSAAFGIAKFKFPVVMAVCLFAERSIGSAKQTSR